MKLKAFQVGNKVELIGAEVLRGRAQLSLPMSAFLPSLVTIRLLPPVAAEQHVKHGYVGEQHLHSSKRCLATVRL